MSVPLLLLIPWLFIPWEVPLCLAATHSSHDCVGCLENRDSFGVIPSSSHSAEPVLCVETLVLSLSYYCFEDRTWSY